MGGQGGRHFPPRVPPDAPPDAPSNTAGHTQNIISCRCVPRMSWRTHSLLHMRAAPAEKLNAPRLARREFRPLAGTWFPPTTLHISATAKKDSGTSRIKMSAMSATGASPGVQNEPNALGTSPANDGSAAITFRAGLDVHTDDATRNARSGADVGRIPMAGGRAPLPGANGGSDDDGDLEELHDGVTKHNTVRACCSLVCRESALTLHPSQLLCCRCVSAIFQPAYACVRMHVRRAQAILKSSGGRSSKNGDPTWTTTFTYAREDGEPWANSHADFPATVLDALDQLKGGGGGWTPAGRTPAHTAAGPSSPPPPALHAAHVGPREACVGVSRSHGLGSPSLCERTGYRRESGPTRAACGPRVALPTAPG